GLGFEGANEAGDSLGSAVALGVIVGSGGAALDELDDGAADNGGVGEFADRAKVFRSGDTEADGNGQLGELAQPLREQGGVSRELVARAGNAGARNRIHESLGGGSDALQSFIGAGGRG